APEEGLRLIRRYSAEGSLPGYNAADALLKAAPTAESTAVLAALEQGLSERAGVPKPPDTALFVDAAKTQRPQQQTALREYAPVTGPLRTHVASLWTQSKSDPLRARLALRANVPGVEEHLIAHATDEAALQVFNELGSAKIVPTLL